MSSEPRLVEVRKNVLKQNDVVARALRERFREAGVFAASLVSSPGSGKTAFLEKTLTLLRARYKVAAPITPSASTDISMTRHRRSWSCASEVRLVDSRSGSMAKTAAGV